MSELAIKVEGLSKSYLIGKPQPKYQTIGDSIKNAASIPMRLAKSVLTSRDHSQSSNTFWALEEISFDVKRGEVIGIIGHNGAGKSTLLKILSRITEPTGGLADIRGRLSSLLEVGTGFHQELTGRENIFLNGAILGMRKKEIERSFDEIVSFAEVEKFVDTQVKHYSSGMYLRLAFAVAAHLEPDILLVDEVLAVGDIAFQKKCLGKMGEVARKGRTVLFVSHNMGAVKQLCQRGILLKAGRVVFNGSAAECIGEYMRQLEQDTITAPTQFSPFTIGPVRLKGSNGAGVISGEGFKASISVKGIAVQNPWMFFIVEDFTGRTLIHSRVSSRDIGLDVIDGERILEVDIPPLWLSAGMYAAYFKFIVPLVGASDGRVVSEKVMLEVKGEHDQTGRAMLSPRIEWRDASLIGS
jgi:lipopolysaccharide transport system ATP-binding protein